MAQKRVKNICVKYVAKVSFGETNLHLASHLIVHSDVKPYECKYNCGFAAKTKGNIQKHENSRKRQKGSNFCGPKYRLNPTHSNSQSDRERAEEIQERQKRMQIKRSAELLRMLGEQWVLLV